MVDKPYFGRKITSHFVWWRVPWYRRIWNRMFPPKSIASDEMIKRMNEVWKKCMK